MDFLRGVAHAVASILDYSTPRYTWSCAKLFATFFAL